MANLLSRIFRNVSNEVHVAVYRRALRNARFTFYSPTTGESKPDTFSPGTPRKPFTTFVPERISSLEDGSIEMVGALRASEDPSLRYTVTLDQGANSPHRGKLFLRWSSGTGGGQSSLRPDFGGDIASALEAYLAAHPGADAKFQRLLDALRN